MKSIITNILGFRWEYDILLYLMIFCTSWCSGLDVFMWTKWMVKNKRCEKCWIFSFLHSVLCAGELTSAHHTYGLLCLQHPLGSVGSGGRLVAGGQ